MSHLSEIEKRLFRIEHKFELVNVPFHHFRASIKKYGYNKLLNKHHLRAISDLIKLDIDALLSKPDSTVAMIFNDPKFAYNDGLYDPYKLLLIGFLYCSF